jgi:hypothetical protein
MEVGLRQQHARRKQILKLSRTDRLYLISGGFERSRNSVVRTVTRLSAGRVGIRILAEARDCTSKRPRWLWGGCSPLFNAKFKSGPIHQLTLYAFLAWTGITLTFRATEMTCSSLQPCDSATQKIMQLS